MADAHGGADAQWQRARCRAGRGRVPRHLALIVADRPPALARAVWDADRRSSRGGWLHCPTCMARRSSSPAAIRESDSRRRPSWRPWAPGSCSRRATPTRAAPPWPPSASGWGRRASVQLVVFDLADLDSVRRGAAEILEQAPRLDVLVNNAGLVLSEREVTVDGYEATFAINHLGPFLLTNLLLDRIRASAPARDRDGGFDRAHVGPQGNSLR